MVEGVIFNFASQAPLKGSARTIHIGSVRLAESVSSCFFMCKFGRVLSVKLVYYYRSNQDTRQNVP